MFVERSGVAVEDPVVKLHLLRLALTCPVFDSREERSTDPLAPSVGRDHECLEVRASRWYDTWILLWLPEMDLGVRDGLCAIYREEVRRVCIGEDLGHVRISRLIVVC